MRDDQSMFEGEADDSSNCRAVHVRPDHGRDSASACRRPFCPPRAAVMARTQRTGRSPEDRAMWDVVRESGHTQ